MSFLEELAKEGVISRNQIGEVKVRAEEKYGGDIDKTLVESGIPEDRILEIKGQYLQMPIRKVNLEEISFDALKYISEDSAAHYHFVPIELRDGVLEVGVINGEDVQAMDALQFISAKIGIPFKIFLISKSDYENIMESYRGLRSQVEEALSELNQEEISEIESLNEKSLSKEIKASSEKIVSSNFIFLTLKSRVRKSRLMEELPPSITSETAEPDEEKIRAAVSEDVLTKKT